MIDIAFGAVEGGDGLGFVFDPHGFDRLELLTVLHARINYEDINIT